MPGCRRAQRELLLNGMVIVNDVRRMEVPAVRFSRFLEGVAEQALFLKLDCETSERSILTRSVTRSCHRRSVVGLPRVGHQPVWGMAE